MDIKELKMRIKAAYEQCHNPIGVRKPAEGAAFNEYWMPVCLLEVYLLQTQVAIQQIS